MGYGQPAYPEDGYDSLEAAKYLQTVKSMADTILSDGNWTYSNGSTKSTWKQACHTYSRKTNCAHFVSLTMQEFGTLKKGQTFYSSGHKIVCNTSTLKQIKKYYDIIDVGGKQPGKCNLQVGDIVLYSNHVNIYAGKDSSGKMLWYEVGKSETSTKRDGGIFKRMTLTGDLSYYSVQHIFRLKSQDSYGSGKKR